MATPKTSISDTKVKVSKTNKSIAPKQPKADKVDVLFRIEQTGKNQFTMEQTITAPVDKVTIKGLASKTAFALTDSLYNLVEKALLAKEQNGYYITSFRPKAVFKITIVVDNRVSFYAVNSKGIDAIRLVKNGKIISRSLLAQKLGLLAETSEAARNFGQLISFEVKAAEIASEPLKAITA